MILGNTFWLGLGFVGQFIFGSRFIVQWIYSEYKKESIVPIVFWYLSILGSVVLLIYSIHLKDPVFIFGFSLNLLIYFRNLVLIFRKNGKSK